MQILKVKCKLLYGPTFYIFESKKKKPQVIAFIIQKCIENLWYIITFLNMYGSGIFQSLLFCSKEKKYHKWFKETMTLST